MDPGLRLDIAQTPLFLWLIRALPSGCTGAVLLQLIMLLMMRYVSENSTFFSKRELASQKACRIVTIVGSHFGLLQTFMDHVPSMLGRKPSLNSTAKSYTVTGNAVAGQSLTLQVGPEHPELLQMLADRHVD